MATITVMDGGVNNSTVYANNDFQYGWLTVAPAEGITIEAGKLATRVGYEVAPSYGNAHATISYDASDSLGFYVEANNDELGTAKSASAVGVGGNVSGVDYSVSYYRHNGYKDLVDIIVATEIAGMPVAANIDYHMLEEAPAPGADDTAYGVALYVTPTIGAVEIPVRVEFLNDGTSGVYEHNGKDVDSVRTFTITPTYRYTENSFVRAELSYVSSDNKIFSDDKGVAEDTKTSFAVQAGFTF